MPLALNIGKCSLLGNYRENNEDSIEVKMFPDMTLCIVADGMGGQAAGEVASKRAIEVVPREIRKNLTAGASVEEARQVIRKAVLQANEEIITMGSLDRDLKNMGTTIVLTLWRRGPEMYVANLGDSRCYHLRGDNIEQLTVDHSLAQALVESKTISAAEAKEHRFRNHPLEIPRQQGSQGRPRRQGGAHPGRPTVSCCAATACPARLQMLDFIKKQTDMQKCADGLGQFALDAGSRDNVSCIVIEVAG